VTILSDKQITERLHRTVIIDPFDPRNVNTSSYDVTLGENYFLEHEPGYWRSFKNFFLREPTVYNIWSKADVEKVWGESIYATAARVIFKRPWVERATPGNWPWIGINPLDKIILIPPKHTILAHTIEFIGGRDFLDGTFRMSHDDPPCTSMMKARSSFGRNFIRVCASAGYGDVGYFNRWTMEIENTSRFYHIPLVVGRRIAQIVFMETGTLINKDYSFAGNYQDSPDLERLKSSWTPSMMLPRLDKDRDIQHRKEYTNA